MARTTRRSSTPRTPRASPRRRTRKSGALPLPGIKLGLSPAVARSLLGIAMLVLGAVLLIALALPGQGQLTDWVRDAIVPFFGAGRWLLPFVLLIAGWYIEWGPGKEPGAPWGRTLFGISLAYTSMLGVFQLLAFSGPQNTGGRIGAFVERLLVSGQDGPGLLPVPAAYVILFAALAVGLLFAFDLPLRRLLSPLTASGRAVSNAFTDARTKKPAKPVTPERARPEPEEKPARLSRGVRLGGGADAPGQAAAWGAEAGNPTNGNVLDEPLAPGSPGPISRTVVTGEDRRRFDGLPAGEQPLRAERAAVATLDRGDADLTALEQLQGTDWTLPPIDLLEPKVASRPGGGIDHATNISRIEEKLRSFAIPA